MTDKVLGHATAYGYYKAGGGTMTEAEFTEFMADFGTASQTAVEAAQAALASETASRTAATTATNKASEATTAATTATNKAAEAQADADAAALDASQAMSAASTATTKATEATTAAATATSAATTATTAKDDAVSAKTAAQTAQTGAETAAASVQSSAAQIQTNADDISELKEDTTQLKSDLNVLEDNFNELSNEVLESTTVSKSNTFTVPTTGIFATNVVLEFKIPIGQEYHIRFTYGADISKITAVYAIDSNGTRSVIKYNPMSGSDYLISATQVEIVAFSIYVESSKISAESDVNVSAYYTLTNLESIESNFNNLKDTLLTESRNIFNSTWKHARYTNDGVYTPVDDTNKNNASVPPVIEVVGGETYAISWGEHPNTNFVTIYVIQVDSNGTYIKSTSYNYSAHEWVLTLEANTAKIGLQQYDPTSQSWDSLIPEWTQIELGDTVTDYIAHEKIKDNLIDASTIFEKIKPAMADPVMDAVHLNQLSNTVKTIAHRGDDVYAPQCVAASYIYARKHGHAIAENDLWVSEDDEFVMWHDSTLSRLGNMVDINGYLMYTDGTDYYWVDPSNSAVYTWNGTNYAASSVALSTLTRCAGANYGVNSTSGMIGLNLDILKRIDFGVYKGQQFKGSQILTFAEWVLLCKQLGMEIVIDKKMLLTDVYANRAVAVVKRYGMLEKATWTNMGPAEVARIRAHDPEARCGVLQEPTAALVEAYAPLNTGRGFFFSGDAKTMTESTVQIGLDAGFDVEAWYVDVTSVSEADQFAAIRRMISYGITALSLDHYRVDEAFKYLLEQY